MTKVQDFYDDFTAYQKDMGINHRHLSIQRLLEENGLKRDHRILEIGCGIGTLTELVLRFLDSNGHLTGVDISPKSIELAQNRLNKYQNQSLMVFDLTQQLIDDQFDVIVLPDVIEHIPLELHSKLFMNISKMLKPSGFALIHIPHPNYLQWEVDRKWEGLQIIDQPIHTHLLASNLSDTGMFIHSLKSYSIFHEGDDYQAIVLKHLPESKHYPEKTAGKEPILRRVKKKLRFILRGKK